MKPAMAKGNMRSTLEKRLDEAKGLKIGSTGYFLAAKNCQHFLIPEIFQGPGFPFSTEGLP